MKLMKATVAMMLLSLLSGVSAAYAHDRDDGDRYRSAQRQDRDDHRDYGYRHDDDGYRWHEYRRHERWEREHRRAYSYNHYRDWDDRGQRVVIGLPLPPLVLPPPPAVVLKRLPAPVIILPRSH
jgi:hypothetical protein